MGLCLVTVSGHVTRDPVVKTFGDQRSLVKIGIAVNRGFGDRQTTDFIEVTVFDSVAAYRFVSEYVKTGDSLTVVGEGKVNTYTKRDGTFAASLEVEAFRVDRASKPQSQQAGDANEQGNPASEGEPEEHEQAAAAPVATAPPQRPPAAPPQRAPQQQPAAQRQPAQPQRATGAPQQAQRQALPPQPRQAPPVAQRGAPRGAQAPYGNQPPRQAVQNAISDDDSPFA